MLERDEKERTNVKRLPLKILIGLAVGVIAGVSINSLFGTNHPRVVWIIDHFTQPIGELFLRLFLMIAIPLLFSAIVIVVAQLGNRRLGRVGPSFNYRFLIAPLALAVAVTLANVDAGSIGDTQKTSIRSAPTLQAVVEKAVPKNPFSSVGSKEYPDMLHLMFFAAIIGIASTLVLTSTASPFMGVLKGLYAIAVKILDIIMKFAPYALACLLFNTTVHFGLVSFPVLAWFLITVLLALTLYTRPVSSQSI